MLDSDLANRIRSIFLHPDPYVTVADAAQMLGWAANEMKAAIKRGEVELSDTCKGKMIAIRELAEKAMELWPLVVIEEALGREASLILPPGVRTRKLVLRLPAYQIAALKILAGDGSESVDTMLMRTFAELADINKERLAPVIPDLAEAIAWPNEPITPQVH